MSFSQNFLTEIKRKLINEREKALQMIEDARNTEDTSNIIGEASEDQAQSLADMGNRVALIDTLEKTLEDIESALKRIEDGSYGICKYCNNPIEEKRLLARPTSSSCLSCKQSFTGK